MLREVKREGGSAKMGDWLAQPFRAREPSIAKVAAQEMEIVQLRT